MMTKSLEINHIEPNKITRKYEKETPQIRVLHHKRLNRLDSVAIYSDGISWQVERDISFRFRLKSLRLAQNKI